VIAGGAMDMNVSLTDCEVIVMKSVWEAESDVALGEVVQRANQKLDRPWKPQTVSTFLARLVRKGFLEMYRNGRMFFYEPLIGELEYGKGEIVACANMWQNNDPCVYLVAIIKKRALRPEEIQSLRKIIEEEG